jgi:hypothetical protein
MTPESFAAPAAKQPSPSLAPGRTSFGRLAQAVLTVTAIAGTLDIIAAHLHIWAARGNFPTTVFNAIAGGALGRERAMQGGVEMIALGAFFHYFISFSFTLPLFLSYPRWRWLRRGILTTSVGYALFVWSTMNLFVLPLSALDSSMPDLTNKHTYIGICVLTGVFALPIVAAAERFYTRART